MTGGEEAFLGFLFQMFGTARLAALDVRRGRVTPAAEVEGQVVADYAQYEHEAYGEDAVTRYFDRAGERDRVLSQYKYAVTTPPRKLNAPDLVRIANGMVAALEEIYRLGAQAASTHYVLTTNRPRAGTCDVLLAAARAGTTHKYLPAGTEAAAAVLADLEILEVDAGQCRSEVWKLGAEFGLNRREREAGLATLLGAIAETTGPHLIGLTHNDIVEHLTGLDAPRRLTPSALAQVMRSDREAFLNVQQIGDPIVRRSIEDELDREDPSVVTLILGPGGCGKSVVLSQLAGRILGSLPELPYAHVAICTARDMIDGWLPTLVASWRSADAPVERPNRCIQRLVVASGTDPQPLLVFVDGLDELTGAPAQVARVAIRQLLNLAVGPWAAEEPGGVPKVRVFVTARTLEEVAAIWPDAEDDRVGDSLREIYVGDYDSEELAERLSFAPSSVRQRLGVWGGRELVQTVGGMTAHGATALEPVPASVLAALRHPLILRFFLEELQLEEQHAFINGSHDAAAKVWSQYLGRFFRRVGQRHGAEHRGRATVVLQCAAAALPPDDAFTRDAWVRSSEGDGRICDADASLVHDEALSYGLVLRDVDVYRWRHPGVQQFLTAAPLPGGGGAPDG